MVSVNSATSGTNNYTTSLINKSDRVLGKSLESLSSGKKVNKASDDAASLAIATSLMSDSSSLKQSSTNLLQGTSLLQTADAGLEKAGNILDRMKSLSTQANSGSVDQNARASINTEYQSLASELNNIGTQTTFNGQRLLDGSYNRDFQSGSDPSKVVNVDLTSVNVSATGLGLTPANGANANALSTQASAAATSSELDTAISNLSSYRAQTGSTLSEFTTQGDIVNTELNSNEEAVSSLRDADIAKERTDFSNSQALSELSIAASAQSNRITSSMLNLVRAGGGR